MGGFSRLASRPLSCSWGNAKIRGTQQSLEAFTYAVHVFKSFLLKNAGLMAIAGVLAYLVVFAALMMICATLLFRRTL